MGMLSSFLHPERAYKRAQRDLDQYYQQGQQAIQPYMQHGQEAYGALSGAMQNLLNPSDFYDQLLGNYKQSDASRFAQERAKNEGLNALSAMGMTGSSPGLQALQRGQSELGAEDELRHMQQMIDLYTKGAGLAQNIYGTGANTAQQYGQNAMNMGQNTAQMTYGQNAAPGNLFGNLLGMGVGAMFPGAGNAWNTFGGKGR